MWSETSFVGYFFLLNFVHHMTRFIHSLRPSDAFGHQTRTSLVQIWLMFNWVIENILHKFNLKMSCANCRPFCRGLKYVLLIEISRHFEYQTLRFVSTLYLMAPGILCIKTLRPKQSCRDFADDIFKCIFSNGNGCISLKISLKFVPRVRINNIPALVQIRAWRRSGDKQLSGSMMA